MKPYIWMLLSLTAVGVFMLSCRQKQTAVRSSGGMIFCVADTVTLGELPDTVHLGRMREGERIVKEFRVRNSGSVPMVVGKVDSDCGCIFSEYDRQPVAPGEEKILSVSFDSGGYRGYILKKVNIVTTVRPQPLTFYMDAYIE